MLEGIIGTLTPDETDRTARPRPRAGIGRILLGGVAGALLTVSLLTVLWWPRTEVTYRDSPPSSVVYADRREHLLGLVHHHTLSGRHSYRLVISCGPQLAYGHWLDIDSFLGADGIESTTWTESGVRVRFPTGHELFVPARFFMYGR
ncbi:hypothetical protein [Streptomyces sp. NPDC058279]|uniref:hypothetical protein n=1 Tax=Streptomyces sp. NPDC058279 TaxID=3346418 RepID=UPI0036E7AA48